MLYNQEIMLTFNYSEISCLKKKVQSSVKIKIIKHIL